VYEQPTNTPTLSPELDVALAIKKPLVLTATVSPFKIAVAYAAAIGI
jgi:hypothetical protein